jgi:hypothetical protein
MRSVRLLAVLALITMSGFLASCDSATEPGNNNNNKPDTTATKDTIKVYGINETVEGKTYRQWATEWWKQMNLTPQSQNILFDETGARVMNGISNANSNVLFLGGVFNESHTAVRTATIPAGKTLFFPILNAQFDTVGTPMSVAERTQLLSEALQTAKDLMVTVDDSVITNIKAYRAPGELFSYTTIENNISGYPAGIAVNDVVSDGFYLAIKPLSKGQHKLQFSGTLPGNPDFHLDITYNLTVQ